jgi:hypothetical protein
MSFQIRVPSRAEKDIEKILHFIAEVRTSPAGYSFAA